MPVTISKNVGAKYDLWLMILGYNNHICRCLPLSSISIFRKFSFQPTRHSIFGQVRRQPQIQFIAIQSACVEGPTFSNKNEVSAFPPTIPYPFFFLLGQSWPKMPPGRYPISVLAIARPAHFVLAFSTRFFFIFRNQSNAGIRSVAISPPFHFLEPLHIEGSPVSGDTRSLDLLYAIPPACWTFIKPFHLLTD